MLRIVVHFEVIVHTGHLDLGTLDLATVTVVSKQTCSLMTSSLLSTENCQGRVTAILDLNLYHLLHSALCTRGSCVPL